MHSLLTLLRNITLNKSAFCRWYLSPTCSEILPELILIILHPSGTFLSMNSGHCPAWTGQSLALLPPRGGPEQCDRHHHGQGLGGPFRPAPTKKRFSALGQGLPSCLHDSTFSACPSTWHKIRGQTVWKESVKGETDCVPWLMDHLEHLSQAAFYNTHPI